MAKKVQDWDRAKALYGIGKTDREIESETNISRATMQRRAKKEGWEKGILSHAIESGIRFGQELSQKTEPEIKAVQNEVERVLKAKGYIENVSLLAIRQLSKLMPKATDMKDIKAGLEAAKVAMVTTGVVDYYPPKEKPVETTINNSLPLDLDDFYTERNTKSSS